LRTTRTSTAGALGKQFQKKNIQLSSPRYELYLKKRNSIIF